MGVLNRKFLMSIGINIDTLKNQFFQLYFLFVIGQILRFITNNNPKAWKI